MLDAQQILDGGIAATGGFAGTPLTASRASTNVLDMLANRDLYNGAEMHVQIIAPFAGGTSLQIEAQTSPDNTTFVGVLDSPVYQQASLVQGALLFRYRLPILQLNDTGLPNRYVRFYYNVVGPFTAGTIGAYLSAAGDRNIFSAYPRNYSQSA